MKGSTHHNFKLGRKSGTKGYALVMAHGHPRASKGYVYEHILIAERAVGKELASVHPVHHANGIYSDNSRGNLVVCEDQSYHQLLHARMEVYRLGGNPNTDKLCIRCHRVLPRSEFTRDSTRADGLRYQCRKCALEIVNKCRGEKKAWLQSQQA